VKIITRISRIIKINYIFVKYNLDEIILTKWFSPFRFFMFVNPWYWLHKNKLTRGERLRKAIEDLGPIFIKAGQVLSTRRDLLPDDIAEELSKLQDQVPPFSGVYAQKTIELALGKKITELFSEFDVSALASASIAQVHAVKLLDGRLAVAKVLRPGIRKAIDSDLDLLFTLARIANKFWPESRRFKPLEIVDEIAHSLYDELDLMREGANASQLRRNFLGSHKLYVPEIYWSYTRANVLVMERIEGIPINNIAAIKEAGINIQKLAERGIDVFFMQVFRDSFFHADMHPGNIFVSTKNLEDPQYIVVDFGIVGSLNSKDQRYLAENMLAFFKRDYQRVAELHLASGWLPPDTRIDQFEGAIRAVCEPIFERPIKDISFGQLLLRLFQTARRFNINIQPQLILLQKTLLNIEGIGAQLDPDLDLWKVAGPYLEKWVKQQVGPKAFIKQFRENLPFWSEKLPEMPGLIYEALTEYKYNQERARYQYEINSQQVEQDKKEARSQAWLGFSIGSLITSMVLLVQAYPAVNELVYVFASLSFFGLVVSKTI
jgi:ubiquinone biosynthesis protein